MTKNGILIIDPLAKPAATISFYSFASRRLQRIGQLPDGSRMAPSKIAVSPDENGSCMSSTTSGAVTFR